MDPGGYIGAVTRMGVRFRGVSVTDVAMPVRAVCKNLSLLTSKRGALATDARGCSLWRSLLERPPPAPESWVRDPLRRVVAVCGSGGLHIYIKTPLVGRRQPMTSLPARPQYKGRRENTSLSSLTGLFESYILVGIQFSLYYHGEH